MCFVFQFKEQIVMIILHDFDGFHFIKKYFHIYFTVLSNQIVGHFYSSFANEKVGEKSKLIPRE